MEVTLTNCMLMTVVAIALSICGMYFVRNTVSLPNLRSHHDVTDPLLAVLGTLFAILLGFMLANSMQRFEEARANIQAEAGAVGDVFRLADALPAALKEKTRKDCMQYVDLVVNDEWKAMANGTMSENAWNAYGDIWQDCLHYDPQTQASSNIHQALLETMTKLGECRRGRAAELHYHLPAPLWVILIFGGFCTVTFTYFFAVDNVRLQILMTSIITTIICLNIYMLAGYDAPFSGDICLKGSAFSTLKEMMQDVSKHKWR